MQNRSDYGTPHFSTPNQTRTFPVNKIAIKVPKNEQFLQICGPFPIFEVFL